MTIRKFKPALIAIGIASTLLVNNPVFADYQYSIPGTPIQGFKPYIAKLGVTGNLVIGATISVPSLTINDGLGGSYDFVDEDLDPDDASPNGTRAKIKWYAVPAENDTDLAGAILLGEGPSLTIPNTIPENYHIGLTITPTTETGVVRAGTELVVNNIAFLAGQKPAVEPNLPGTDPVVDPALPGNKNGVPNPGVLPPNTNGVPVKEYTLVQIYELKDFKANGLNAQPLQSINTYVKTSYVARVIAYADGIAPKDITKTVATAAKPIQWRLLDSTGTTVALNSVAADSTAKTRLSTLEGDTANSNTIFTTQTTNDDAAAPTKLIGEYSEQGLLIVAGADLPAK